MSWLLSNFGMGQGVIKLSLKLAMMTALIGFIYWGYDNVFDAGYNARRAEEVVLIERSITEKSVALLEAKNTAEGKRDKALEDLAQLKLIKEKTKVIYREIPTIVEKSSCADLGTDVHSLLLISLKGVNQFAK